MRLSLQIYGGIAGGMQPPASSLDVAPLSGDLARQTARLVEAAISAHPQAQPAPARADEMSYTITIEESGSVTVLKENETSMTPAFAGLLEWIERLLSNP